MTKRVDEPTDIRATAGIPITRITQATIPVETETFTLPDPPDPPVSDLTAEEDLLREIRVKLGDARLRAILGWHEEAHDVEACARTLMTVLDPPMARLCEEHAAITMRVPLWQFIAGHLLRAQDHGVLGTPPLDARWRQAGLVPTAAAATCEYCHRPFEATRPRQRFCRTECGAAAQLHADVVATEQDARAARATADEARMLRDLAFPRLEGEARRLERMLEVRRERLAEAEREVTA